MFCHKCGAQLAEGAVFCQKCGAKVASVDTTQEPQEIPEPIEIPEPNVENQYSSEAAEDTQQTPTNKTSKAKEIIKEILLHPAELGPILIWVSLILLLPFWPFRISPAILVTGVAIGIILSALGTRPLGFSKIIELAVAVVLLVVIIVTSISSGGKSNKYVQIVKNGTLNLYPQITVGEAFDNFLDKPKWESGLAENDVRFVNVKGGISYYDKEAELVVQFFVDEKTDSFQYNACEINGVPQNDLIFWNLLYTIYNGGSASANSNSRGGSTSVLEEITIGETHSFTDLFGNMEVTLNYVQFMDRLLNKWTGLDEYPDEDFVFLCAAITVKNIGTTSGSILSGSFSVVYDGTYEFTGYRAEGDLTNIPPLSASTEGTIIFMVPAAVIDSDKSLVLNTNGYDDGIFFTIRPGAGLQGNFSDGTTGMENNTSTGELLVDGYSIYELLGAPIDSVVSLCGSPLNIDGNWGIYYQYDGFGFSVDNHEIVYGATMFPDMCSLNGISLDKSRSELIEILGIPTSEGYYDNPDAFDTYYMLYEGFYGESNLIIDLYDDTAVWLYIGDYEV